MFYEIDSINNTLVCSSCSQVYDLPKLLPCGNTICTKCERLMLHKNDNGRYVCSLCGDVHFSKANILPINKTVNELLCLVPCKVYRGRLHEEAVASLIHLRKSIDIFTLEYENKPTAIDNYCNQLKYEIKRHTDEQIMILNSQRSSLLRQVETYRGKCLDNLRVKRDMVDNMIKNYENFCINSESVIERACLNEHVISNIIKFSSNAQYTLNLFARSFYFYKNQLEFKQNLNSVGSLQFKSNENASWMIFKQFATIVISLFFFI